MDLILTFDDAYDSYVRHGVTGWDTLTRRVGRNDLPAILELVAHELTNDELAVAVSTAWVMAEYPEEFIGRDPWLEWFGDLGYMVNGKRVGLSERPDTITLYRGAIEPARMAWTSDQATAECFRDRPQNQGSGRLWTAEVPGDHLLAHFNNVRLDESGQSENEYVINPVGLKIDEVLHLATPDDRS